MPHPAGSHKLQPRSAGTPRRPLRNENLSDLVHFFQETNENRLVPLRVPARPEGTFGLLKAGHQRLRQLAQPKSHRRSTDNVNNAPLPSVVAGGIKIPAAAPKGDDGDSPGTTGMKQAVEANGPLRLADAVGAEDLHPQSVLGDDVNAGESPRFREMGAMIEFSLAFSGDEVGPPPYSERVPRGGLETERMEKPGEEINIGPASASTLYCSNTGGEAPGGPGSTSTPEDRTAPDPNNHHRSSSSSSNRNIYNHARFQTNSNRGGICISKNHDANSLGIWLCTAGDWEHGQEAVRALPTRSRTPGASVTSSASDADSPSTASATVSHNVRPIPLGLIKDATDEFPMSASFTSSPNFRPPEQLSSSSPPPRPKIPLVDRNEAVCESLQRITVPLTGRGLQPHGSSIESITAAPTARARSLSPDVQNRKRTTFTPMESQIARMVDLAPRPASTKPLAPPPYSGSGDNAVLDQTGSSKQSTPPACLMPTSPSRFGTVTPEKLIPGQDHPNPDGPRQKKHPKSLAPPVSLDSCSCATSATRQEDRRPKSPAPADLIDWNLQQLRRARSEKVHALRMRDIAAARDRVRDRHNDSPEIQSKEAIAHEDNRRPLADFRNAGSRVKPESPPKDVHARPAPTIPLPADPPVGRSPIHHYRRPDGSNPSSPLSVTSSAPAPPVTNTNSMSAGSGSHVTSPNTTYQESKSCNARSQASSLPSSDDDSLRMHARSTRGTKRRNASHKCDDDRQAPSAGASPLSPRSSSAASKEHSPSESQHSRGTKHSAPDYVRHVEARVTLLERQNKLLQAALLTALDIGLAYKADCMGGSAPGPMSPDSFMSVSPRSIKVTQLDDVMKVEVDEIDRAQELFNKNQRLLHLNPKNAKKQAFRSSIEIRDSQRSSLEALEQLIKEIDTDCPSDDPDRE
jgi:hypothetical protein